MMSCALHDYVLRCPVCKSKTKLTSNTMFDGSKLNLRKLLGLIYMWTYSVAVSTATTMLGVSSATTVQWYQYFQDICSWKLLQEPIVLSGIGKTVEIDESVVLKAKYNRGRHLRQQQRCVFGGYEGESKQGFACLRSAATLIPIIQQVIAPGIHIMSDEWASYRQLASLGYTHTTINHSQHFVDPDDGTCTNRIEAYWNAVKRRFNKMYGTAKEMVPSYLDEHVA